MDASSAEGSSWVASVVRILRSTEERSEGPLTLLELADLIAGWAQTGRASAWSRNRTYLAAEIGATAEEAEEWADDATTALLVELHAVVDSTRTLDDRARASILEVVQAIRARLTNPQALELSGARLITMAQNIDVPLARLAMARELLDDQVNASGRDSRYVLMDAAWRLSGDSNERDTPESLEVRVDGYLDTLSRRPEPVPLVAWLEYEDAQIHPEWVSAGPLTFFSGRWAVPNARQSGQDFPFREELAAYLRAPASGFTEEANDAGKVVVRVDLGVRQTFGALEDAAEMVAAVVDLAVDRVSGLGWRAHGVASLEINGDHLGAMYRFGRFEAGDHRRRVIEATGAEVARWGEKLGATLSSGPLPPLLRDAIGFSAARRALEQEDHLPLRRLRDRNLRLATSMDDQIVEAVAGWAVMETSALEDALRHEWVEGRWQAEIGQILQTAVWESRRSQGYRRWDLERALVEHGDGGDTYMLGGALEYETEVLELLVDPHDRTRGESVIAALRDPVEWTRVYGEGATHLSLGLERVRRTRNALAHGNPVSLAVISRCRPLARFLASGALDLAVRALTARVALPALLEQRQSERATSVETFRAGTSWPSVWEALRDH